MHLYLPTRFSNQIALVLRVTLGFTPLFTYKVLKRYGGKSNTYTSFTPLFTYKVLKPFSIMFFASICFTPLFTYKVLKHAAFFIIDFGRFTPLFTYKILKLITWSDNLLIVSHLYLLTRFSNSQSEIVLPRVVSHLYLLTRFSNHFL